MTGSVTSVEPGTAIPRFLTHHSGTRGLRRLTPVSRSPVTGRIGEVFHVAAEHAPDRLLRFDRPSDLDPAGRTSFTIADWATFVDEAAGWLSAAGVEPWDRVAIVKSNHFDVSGLSAAAARIGAVPAPMAHTHAPETLATLLGRLERPVLVADAEQLAGLDDAVLSGLAKRVIAIDGAEGRPAVTALDDLRGSPPPPPRLRAHDEPMVIPHTSGTTGDSKLVVHSAESMGAQAHVETERWPYLALRSRDRVAFNDPYFHNRSFVAVMVFATICPELLALSGPDIEAARRVLPSFAPTVFETLPNIYLAWEPLAREPDGAFRDVRLFLSSFDAIHTRTIRTFMAATARRAPVWIQSWSQSEIGAIAIRPYTRSMVRAVGRRPTPSQLVGWAQPFVGKLRAVDPADGRPLRTGEPGLVQVSVPGRCLAYVGEQHRHDLKVDGEWWVTGDMGVLNRTDAVRLLDREVDHIPGASCIEIEDVLLDRLPQLTEAVVLGRPGELPAAVVSTAGDGEVDGAAWAAATADLPALAPPVRIRWDEFPRTATWKIRRNELRERLFHTGPLGRGTWT
jgi:acyl-coenzyme A synthetase/AMP-(fatty) acid ligase